MAEFATPPSTLGLMQSAGQSISQMPKMAHPLTEQLVRDIEAGRKTSEQAFAEAQAYVQTQQQPQPQQPATPMGAPQQSAQQPAAASLGAAPAPQQPAAPQAPAPSLAGPPPIAPELAGGPALRQPMPAQPIQQAQAPAPTPVNNGQQPDPMANAGNAAPGPSFDSNLNKGRNQIGDSLANTLPAPQRQAPPSQVSGSPGQGPSQQPQAQAPATGYQAGRNAMVGPRMSEDDVRLYMDAYVKGGRPEIERMKEAGRMNRAGQTTQRLDRAADVRQQRVNDQWEVETGRLALDKQREADKLAMEMEKFNAAEHKLQAAALRFAANREDKVALLDMKLAHDELQTYIKSVSQMGSSIMAEAPTTHALIEGARERAGEAAKHYEAIRDFTVSTQSNAAAPAPNRSGAEIPAMSTAGERSGITRKASPAKKAAPASAAPLPAPTGGPKVGATATLKDGTKVTLQADGSWK